MDSRDGIKPLIINALIISLLCLGMILLTPKVGYSADIYSSMERFKSDLNRASHSQNSQAFLKTLETYLAEDAQIFVQTQGTGIGTPPIPHQQQMTKEQYLKQARQAQSKLENYQNKASIIGVNVLDGGQVATFTVNSEASGTISVDNSFPGLEDLTTKMKASFQSFNSCVNTATVVSGKLQIQTANCTGSMQVAPVNVLDQGLEKSLKKYGYN